MNSNDQAKVERPLSPLELATAIIRKSSREQPADAVLRAELKRQHGLDRATGRAVSRMVFGYFRWLGWLNHDRSVAAQIEQAEELSVGFSHAPARFADAELLAKAFPPWVAAEMEVTPAWARSLQTEPRLWLRARLGQGSQLADKLGECWISPDPRLGDAVEYCGGEDLFRTEEFHAGEFELQDLSSQLVGLLCDPKPGQTWWDACAGQGGKLLHLSGLMGNKGLIWASDRAEWRLKKLKQRAARAKVFNYRGAAWDGGAKLPTKTKFDGVLVDAPCSGLGTWQRNPHARWTVTPEDVRELGARQAEMLAHVAPSLKPGGRLVYSVCTLTRAETVGVVEEFEKRFPNFKPWPLAVPSATGETSGHPTWIWPQDFGGNGMFVAAWERSSAIA